MEYLNAVELSNLSIGFNSEVKVIEHNVFEIGGDITIMMKADDNTKPQAVIVDKLKVVYNNDGMLDHVYNGKDEPDSFILFKDVEKYVNQTYNVEIDLESYYTDIPISDSKAVEVFADIYI